MSVYDDVLQGVFKFYNNAREDRNGRFLSWEHCYYNFYKARNEKNPDVDYLSLQLAFYLASWGMYRGSSFLLEKDYKVHRPIVEEILKSEYHELFSANCDSLLNEDIQNKLEKLISFMDVARGTFNLKSIAELAEFYKSNYDEFEMVRQKLWVKDVEYPQMKLLDMGFWQIGKSAKEEKKMEDKV